MQTTPQDRPQACLSEVTCRLVTTIKVVNERLITFFFLLQKMTSSEEACSL